MYIVHSCIPVWEARGDSAQVSSPELKRWFLSIGGGDGDCHLGQADNVRGGAGQSGEEERTSR